MSESIRILTVEDQPTDAELAQKEICRALKSCVFQNVETQAAYVAALEVFKPDLIITDYRMPHFDGLTALKLALEKVPFTPVII
jgi:two-component system, cell cycle sensor histidine kinase and response regulator CckA